MIERRGKFSPVAPRVERICPVCEIRSIEDENHRTFICSFYNEENQHLQRRLESYSGNVLENIIDSQ